MAADTGHGGSITLGTSGLTLDILSVSPPEETVEDVETSHLGLSDGAHRTYMPGDLIEGGELSARVAFTGIYAAPLRVVENITVTFPDTSTYAFSGYTKSWAPDTLETDGRMEGDITIKVAGDITKTPAA